MIYEYNEKIVNRSNIFNNKNNFVGYILPDGNIYECKEHNVSGVYSAFIMFMDLVEKDFDKKNEILNNAKTSDKLAQLLFYKLKNMSLDEIKAYKRFKPDDYSMSISDIIVSFFGCHMVTRSKKQILTSELDHHCFYNYLLHDFTIETIPKIVYDSENKEYFAIEGKNRNDYLYDEINRIKKEISEEEIELFHKTK